MPLWNIPDSIRFGYVHKKHGYAGAVRVAFFVPLPRQVFQPGQFVFVEHEGSLMPLKIKSLKSLQPGHAIMQFHHVESDGFAARFASEDLYMSERQLPESLIAELRFFNVEGFAVEDRNGDPLGQVQNLMKNRLDTWLLEIDSEEGEEALLLPYHPQLVLEHDSQAQRLRLDIEMGNGGGFP